MALLSKVLNVQPHAIRSRRPPMRDADRLRGAGKRFEPIQDLGAVGVTGEAFEGSNFGAHRHVFAVDLDALCSADNGEPLAFIPPESPRPESCFGSGANAYSA